MKEPLSNGDAKRLLVKIITGTGRLDFSSHALAELANDGLDQVTATKVILSGYVEGADLMLGSWRYRVRTTRVVVTVAFRSEAWAVVVTAWKRRGG